MRMQLPPTQHRRAQRQAMPKRQMLRVVASLLLMDGLFSTIGRIDLWAQQMVQIWGSIAKRVACKMWTFDAKDSGIVLFLHGNLRWNGKLLKHWIESSDLFAQLWYLFLECQTKQHAARSCYIHESELPYKVELSKSYGSLHNRSTYNINTRLAFKQWLNVMVSFDFFDRQSNTQQDCGQKCGRLLGDFVIDLSYCKLIRGI